LRIDSIKLDPLSTDPSRLMGQVVVLSLAEKSEPTVKAKPEVAKKPNGMVGKGKSTLATLKAMPVVVKQPIELVRKGNRTLNDEKAKPEVVEKP
jgi:hypothetical protein